MISDITPPKTKTDSSGCSCCFAVYYCKTRYLLNKRKTRKFPPKNRKNGMTLHLCNRLQDNQPKQPANRRAALTLPEKQHWYCCLCHHSVTTVIAPSSHLIISAPSCPCLIIASHLVLSHLILPCPSCHLVSSRPCFVSSLLLSFRHIIPAPSSSSHPCF